MKRLIKQNLLPIALILIISLLLSIPLFKLGFYQIHDDQQIARLFLFDKALQAGQFPVRWVDGLGFGFGYPLFIFYPPLVYWLGEVFHLLGTGFVDAIKIVFFLSLLLSGISMYLFAKKFVGRLGGLTASLFYILTPYRAVDIYVRGSLSEAFSFVWLPLILLFFYKLKNPTRSSVILCGVSLGGLMITHNLVLMSFMLILPIYVFYLWASVSFKRNFIIYSLLAVLIGTGLSAFFWVPSIFEKKYTLVDQILLVDLANYKIHFVYLQQLWNSPWGFGGSAAGLNDGLSFKIGKLNVLVSFLVVVLSLLIRKKSKSFLLTIVFFALFIISAFMTTNYSRFIWETLTPLNYLQFPWRFLIMTTLFTSILAGLFVKKLSLPILKIIAFFSLTSLLLFTNVKLFKPQTYRPELTNKAATDQNLINWDVSLTSFEYAPKGVELYRSSLGTNLINITKQEIPKEKINVEKGAANISITAEKPDLVQFTSNSDKGAQIKVNTFNFPGWRATIDGQTVSITDNNKLKLINLYIPAGNHDVTIKFENTLIIKIANLISIFSIAFVIYLIFIPKILQLAFIKKYFGYTIG